MERLEMNTLLSDSDLEDGTVYRADKNGNSFQEGQRTKKKVPKFKNRRFSRPSNRISLLILSIVLAMSMLLNVVFAALFILRKDGSGAKSCPQSPLPSSESIVGDNSPTDTSTVSNPVTPVMCVTSKQDEAVQKEASSAPQPQAKSSDSQSKSYAECRDCDIPVCAKPFSLWEKERQQKNDKSKRENIFSDLTSQEMAMVYTFLAHQPSLKIGLSSSTCNVFGIELHVPNKTQALLYLDSYAPKPAREARVVVECGHEQTPLVHEYVVGPLPKPSYYVKNPRRKSSTIPYRFFPRYGLSEAFEAVFRELGADLDLFFQQNYGTTFRSPQCGTKCITFLPQRTSSAYSDRTLVILSAYYKVEFTTINPLDFIVVSKESAKGNAQFHVDGVYHGGQYFKSARDFLTAFKSGSLKPAGFTFPKPANGETSIQGSMQLRGKAFPTEPQAGPKEFEPEGKRYSIDGQHVEYLEWSFDVRMSTASGPQVWDVRWAGERIAYEISLQDVGVIYAGANPTTFYTHLSDSAFGLGDKATGLLPGLDCPDHATFLSQVIFSGGSGTTTLLPHAQCIFEHNTGVPLRRHRNDDSENGRSHGGLMDRVLVVRSIIVEYNYDYIFDTVFHQNGAVELKTYATGYVMSQHYRHAEDMFGFRIHEDIVGSIHHHMFNFKVDLDIQGASNRYETLDFVTDDRTWPWYESGTKSFKQLSFRKNLKKTEHEALLRYNYSTPKYHIVYNQEEKNVFGNPKAYRIGVKGFSKQMLPDDSLTLNSRRWSKYEMAVTKRADEEEASSSIFSMYDGEQPHVDFDDYLTENESIVDEDLVFWITVGMHHIPHTEDIPNTPTVGTEATISIMPYNYFTECPSVSSRDSIRTNVHDSKVVLEDYGSSLTSNCVPRSYDYRTLFSRTSTLYS